MVILAIVLLQLQQEHDELAPALIRQRESNEGLRPKQIRISKSELETSTN